MLYDDIGGGGGCNLQLPKKKLDEDDAGEDKPVFLFWLDAHQSGNWKQIFQSMFNAQTRSRTS